MLLILGCHFLQAQNVYIVPSLGGFLNDNTLNARSEAMGKVTITLDGVQTAFENPAVLSLSEEKFSFSFNVDAGNSIFPNSYYTRSIAGYRLNNRIAVGLEYRNWVETDPLFTTIIGITNYPVDRRSRNASTLMVAGNVTKNLHFGVSGTYLVEKRLERTKTGDMFLMNIGLVYDKETTLFRNEIMSNQKLRFATSLFNTLMNPTYVQTGREDVTDIEDIPIILRAGASFSFTKTITIGFAQRSKWFKEQPQTLDLSTHLQYTDWLGSKDYIFASDENHRMVSVGVEGLFYDIVSIRLGYFTETRGTRVDPDERAVTKGRRKAFTWGTGFRLPTNKWSKNKFPFETQFDLLVKGMPDLLIERFTERTNPQFTDDKTQLSVGLLFKLKKYEEDGLSSSPNEEGTF